MRPRQSSLGIITASIGILLDCQASMRPRQSSLGISRGATNPAWTNLCFNEAEAIKPRNRSCSTVPETTSWKTGFNEAEAIKPRNRVRQIHHAPRSRASMRPRQSSLGIHLQHLRGRWELQCGFNEAEAIKPRNPSSARRALVLPAGASMRPRQSSLGIDRAIPGSRVAPAASMRPRQSSLGIPSPARAPTGTPGIAASMRPRQSSLGIGSSHGPKRKHRRMTRVLQ